MSTLISDLLTYSCVTTKANPLEKIKLDAVVKDVIDDLQSRIESQKAEIKVEKLGSLYADELQMRLLFQNLISNALKYAKHDIPIKIKIYSKPKEGTITIYVQDNGIGFEEKYLDKIFTIFQRLHSKNEYEGTGIGLAICKKVVERHHGTITAKSTVGKGSTFIVTLPKKP